MKNILICEDDPIQLKVLLAAFSRAGYATSAARSPGQALRQLQEIQPDVIVSDVRLEEGDAFEVLHGAKRIGLDAPMIMISAYSTDALRAKAIHEGAARFFDKSPNHRELVERVEEVVREHRTLRLGARVLVVDGDRAAAEAISRELDRAGFDTVLAEDGPRGVALARLAQPVIDFAVVNLKAKSLGGVTLVKALRVAQPGVYIVMFGGTPSREELRAAYAAGGQAFFRTPLTLADLARHLVATVGRAREMRRAAAQQLRQETRPRRRLKAWLRGRWKALSIGTSAIALGIVLGAVWGGVLTAVEEEARRVERTLQEMERKASLSHLHQATCSHPLHHQSLPR